MRREGVGTAGREAVKSPRLSGEGWLLRLSRLVEEPMRLWRRLTSAGLPCRLFTSQTEPHNDLNREVIVRTL